MGLNVNCRPVALRSLEAVFDGTPAARLLPAHPARMHLRSAALMMRLALAAHWLR
jgi:hypothetical protein